jgi:hypothetical protein
MNNFDYNCNMKDLLKVSTYAKKINKSVTWVYKLADEGVVCELVEIDGVKFIREKN